MVVVLLVPVALILVACLLDQLERRVLARPPGVPAPVARPAAPVAALDPVADVVPLRSEPVLDGATLPLRRAS